MNAHAGLLLLAAGCMVTAPRAEPPPATSPATPAAAGQPPSILLVSLDTLRADRLGAYGNPRGLTPNLDAFARDAVVFTHAYAQANITSMSHASLFTSRYPSELGRVGPTFRLGKAPPTLAEVLHVYGYDTAAFTAGGHMSTGFGLDRGFGTFVASTELGSLWHSVPPALAWLDARPSPSPFLLLVHGYDAHAPYLEPTPYGLGWADPAYHGTADDALQSFVGTELIFDDALFHTDAMIAFLHQRDAPRVWDAAAHTAVAEQARQAGASPFGPADARRVRDVYDGAAAYADALFGHLVAELRARGAFDDLVVVVLADHGETLGEDGRYGHGDSLADVELQVPLLVRLPAALGGHGGRVDAPVALLDVLPTLLDVAGAAPPAGIHGQSLAPWLRGATGPGRDVVFSEGNTRMVSARSAAGRLTFAGVSADSPYLSDLLATAAIEGPAFTTDTTIADPAGREALRADLAGWRATLSPAGDDVEPADPAAVEAMRKRGYWAPR